MLLPEEVGLIESPYSLICFAGKYPLMLMSPDLSYYNANKELGLGDKEFNKKLIMERNASRKERPVQKINLWGIWNEYKEMDEYDLEDEYEDNASEERISFLD